VVVGRGMLGLLLGIIGISFERRVNPICSGCKRLPDLLLVICLMVWEG